jgi:hypothetical protein
MLMLIGFFKKQVLITIFSGIGFMMIGWFIFMGVSYDTGSVFTDTSWTVTEMVNTTAVWHTSYDIPIMIFLNLFGLALIFMGAFDFFSGKKTHITERDTDDGGGDDE